MRLVMALAAVMLPVIAQEPPYLDMREPDNRAVGDRILRHIAEAAPEWKLDKITADSRVAEGTFTLAASPSTTLHVQVGLATTPEIARSLGWMLISVAPDITIEYKGRSVRQWKDWNQVTTSVGKVSLLLSAQRGADEALMKKALDAALEAAEK